MSTPHIVIQRHDVGLYEWLVLYGQDKIDGEAGDTSITECLVSALGVIPEDEKLAEITYRGIHMGTFHILQIQEYAEGVSERIVDFYAELAPHL
ncbi:hypothetical protein [Collimonas silvisoli]|uniref:hypothetical protein n=1 Tax=Collimonas silvisoli TaxID=2825884 RepID=UPI001B8B4FF1|nr:hypothetical protein [Collimonas silvisoli]